MPNDSRFSFTSGECPIIVDSICGYFTTLQIQADRVAQTAARILKGTCPNDIPIVESPKTFAFDWKEVQRFNIRVSDLPQGRMIYNMPLEVRYLNYIIAGGIPVSYTHLRYYCQILSGRFGGVPDFGYS